ncbi:MAG: COP23 domain-containing protein [Leptolyngbyaceae cyanobacterium]
MVNQWQRWVAASLSCGLACAGIVSQPVLAQSETQTEPTEDSTTEDVSLPETPADDEIRFTCELQNGQPTVMYAPISQPGNQYAWATPDDMGSAWPAERRCAEISRRLETYRPDGLLELQTGRENGYNTVCVTTEADASCRIVFTVPAGQDPTLTRDRVFDNLVLADQGQTTQGVNTLVEGDNLLDGLSETLGFPGNQSLHTGGINLQPFLDAADGGTGTQLDASNGLQLNPDNF